MKPGFPATPAAASMADRLATLAGLWPNAAHGREHPHPRAELDAFRDGLADLALFAEAGHQDGFARALRRITLLSEIWECLECEPDRTDAAAEVANFCQTAIEQLACDHRTGGGDLGICDEIIRQSDSHWSDYLSPLDSISAGEPVADDHASGDENGITYDDAPSALDQVTLLRLLQGSRDDEKAPAQDRILPEPTQKYESRGGPPTDGDRGPRASSNPGTSILVPRKDEQRPGGRIEKSQRLGLAIPPLPARCDLDDEMREAFLADTIDLFERIESILTGLGSLDNHGDAIQELCRCFHTLKGAAGSVGLNELSTLVHELEERLGETSDISPELNDLLHQVVDYLEKLIDWLRRVSTASSSATSLPVLGECKPLPRRAFSCFRGSPPAGIHRTDRDSAISASGRSDPSAGSPVR